MIFEYHQEDSQQAHQKIFEGRKFTPEAKDSSKEGRPHVDGKTNTPDNDKAEADAAFAAPLGKKEGF